MKKIRMLVTVFTLGLFVISIAEVQASKIKLTSVKIPFINNPAFNPPANSPAVNLLDAADNGTLGSETNFMGYVVNKDHLTSWTNMCATSNLVDAILVQVWSDTGGNDEAMESLKVVFKSSDPGNLLGTNVTFVNTSYTPLARLRQNGNPNIVTSGASSQKGSYYSLIVFSKMFSGGGTSVSSYVNVTGPLRRITYTATTDNDPATTSMTFVDTTPNVAPIPALRIAPGMLWVTNKDDVTYNVYTSTEIQTMNVPASTNSIWTNMVYWKNMMGTNVLQIPTNNPHQFFRVMVQ